jgi:hypothetical protein
VISESQIDGAEDDRSSLDRRPTRRLARIAVWIGGMAVAIWVLDLLGIPVREWIDELFDKLGEIPPGAIVAAVILQSPDRDDGARLVRDPACSPPTPPPTRSPSSW